MRGLAPRILIIDDSGYMRDLLRLHLKAAGYEVELAEDAVVAGHSILRAVPDLIICDVDMPLLLTELLATVARHIPGGPPEEASVPFITRPKRYRSQVG